MTLFGTLILLPLLLFLSLNNAALSHLNEQLLPPRAKKVPTEFTLFNTTIEDEYAWLRAKEWPSKITDKEVLSYLEEENDYYAHFMHPLQKERDDLFQEFKGRVQLNRQSADTKRDNYLYYNRQEEGKEYDIYCRRLVGDNSTEEILLDVNKEAEGHVYTTDNGISVSPNHTLMTYTVDHSGKEQFTIKVYDLLAKQYLPDEINDTVGCPTWHESEQLTGFYYTPNDEFWRTNVLMFHQLGRQVAEDKEIFRNNDTLYTLCACESGSKDYLFVVLYGMQSGETYYIPMQDMDQTPRLMQEKRENVMYSVGHNSDYFYMATNEDAENYKLVRAKIPDAAATDQLEWEVYIPEDKERNLDDFDLTKHFLLLTYKVKGLPVLEVQELSTGLIKRVSFPDAVYEASMYTRNYEEDDIFVRYSSLARPGTQYSYDFHTNELTILKEEIVPSGFNPSEYKVERVYAPSGEVQVPVTLFYKKEHFKQDGSMPLYLYGYGSYGADDRPGFQNTVVSLVDRGFLYAMAHIRGGGILGRPWYEAAKFLTKKRTFEDFIAVADSLIEQNYTTQGNIVCLGGSAGGLLIGAVINMRPELFKAAIAHVPFVDVLNTMLDENLPLTPLEYKEWGNPREEDYFHYIRSYSPYDNVKEQNYPAILTTGGLSDPRVGYWEPAKWVARLRDRKTDNNLILFKTNMEFGHGGASGRFNHLKVTAEYTAFVFHIFHIDV